LALLCLSFFSFFPITLICLSHGNFKRSWGLIGLFLSI
jgi:hypothetical protein